MSDTSSVRKESTSAKLNELFAGAVLGGGTGALAAWGIAQMICYFTGCEHANDLSVLQGGIAAGTMGGVALVGVATSFGIET